MQQQEKELGTSLSSLLFGNLIGRWCNARTIPNDVGEGATSCDVLPKGL
jgi:hypothetical protein